MNDRTRGAVPWPEPPAPSTADTLHIARGFVERGWCVTPLRRNSKGSSLKGWQKLRLSRESLPQYFPPGALTNIGILTGSPSGNLVDIDLDCAEAVALAGDFLPSTGAVFGRSSKPRAHFLYQVTGALLLKTAFKEPGPRGQMLLEIRTDGCMTMAPGSCHPEGELVEWAEDGPPAQVDAVELARAVAMHAAATLLARNYPESGRDLAALAISGVLTTAGFPPRAVDEFNGAVARVGGSDDVPAKSSKGDRTKQRVDTGAPVMGVGALSASFGAAVSHLFCDWLGIAVQPGPSEVKTAIEGLSASSSVEMIEAAIVILHRSGLSELQTEDWLRQIADKTERKFSILSRTFRTFQNGGEGTTTDKDQVQIVAQSLICTEYEGGRHLICTGGNAYWTYKGTHWVRLDEEQIEQQALQLLNVRLPRQATRMLNGVTSTVRVLSYRKDDPLRLARDPLPIINCLNGELDVATDGTVTLSPHKAASYLTSVLGVAYDPSAEAPLFRRTLLEIFAKAEDPEGLASSFCELMGYAAYNRRHIPTWVLLIGNGRNGKSRLVETLLRLMSPSAVCSRRLEDLERDQFAIGELVGKRVFIDDDLDASTKLPDGLLKKISESKPLTGQVKYGRNFEFVAHCLPILCANSFPSSRDVSLGIRRRALIFPFDRSFSIEEDDKKLFPRIWEEELPGILNVAIDGLQRLLARGAFADQKDLRAARRRWLAAADTFVAFVQDACSHGPDESVSLQALFDAYKEWAAAENLRIQLSRNQVKRKLESLDFALKNMGGGRPHVIGLGISEVDF